MSDRYIVELEPGVWLAEWAGDPGRTSDRASAKVYMTVDDAIRGKARARRFRPLRNARIVTVEYSDPPACTCPTIDGVPVTGSACEVHGLEKEEQ